MSYFDDGLTDADLAFLNRFNKLGRSDSADSEYNPSQDEIPDAEGDQEAEAIADFEMQDGENDLSGSDERRTDIEGDDQSDEIDDSKMNLSEIESGDPESNTESSDKADEKDHLEAGDSDSEIEEGEDDLEYDQDLSDHSEAEDDELDTEDAEHQGEPDSSDGEGIEDEPELGGDDAKIEEDDGEGERGNSDEARESDEPIKSGDDDSDSEADELSEDHAEQELNAEGDSDFEGDAQQELEDHLQNQDKPEVENQSDENPKDDEESEPPKDDEQQGGGNEGGEGHYSDLPASQENCTDHCEDNDPDGAEHECPRCAERIMRERKEWGVIAQDMNNCDVFPGDKLRVEIPMSFFAQDAILTANVPNEEMERFAVKTNGTVDRTACWLSGHRISQFTGYHFGKSDGPSIWTFTQGRRLRFAEKIGEPEREGGGQGDIEDMIEQLNDELDQGKFDQEPEDDFKDEHEQLLEEENQNDEPEPEDENGEQQHHGKLTTTQMRRFESLFERITNKVKQTFGNTAEVVSEGDVYVTDDGRVARPIQIRSRGVEYNVVLVAARSDA